MPWGCGFCCCDRPVSLRRVHDLLIHFTSRQQPDHSLKPGVHRLVRQSNGSLAWADDRQDALLLAQFCLDLRGLWLQVADGICGVHVNGRPVVRMALLRAGDAVYVDGVEMLLRGGLGAQPSIPAVGSIVRDAISDPCLLLRGVAGRHHGRSFTLDRMRVVGGDPLADIVIADPVFVPRHARLERHGEAVLLRDLGSEDGTLVNGVVVRDCWLYPGDQVVFGGRDRFVLEMPQSAGLGFDQLDSTEPESPSAEMQASAPKATQFKIVRWPLLLLSALLLAGLLSALLWFGAH